MWPFQGREPGSIPGVGKRVCRHSYKKLAIRSYDVTVSISDFESGHLGSNPSRSLMSSHSKIRILSNPRRQHKTPDWRNWIARKTSKPFIGESILRLGVRVPYRVYRKGKANKRLAKNVFTQQNSHL